MVTLRATQKVLRSLPKVGLAAESRNSLGDWYVNRLVIDRQPLLLLVSAKSRLAILEPARDVKHLPDRLPYLVGERLKRLPCDLELIGAEVEATTEVAVGHTTDRSVLGQLVDFAKTLPFIIPEGQWGVQDLRNAEDRLADTPCRSSASRKEVIWPARKAVQLLQWTWAKQGVQH